MYSVIFMLSFGKETSQISVEIMCNQVAKVNWVMHIQRPLLYAQYLTVCSEFSTIAFDFVNKIARFPPHTHTQTADSLVHAKVKSQLVNLIRYAGQAIDRYRYTDR